ncbi:MAG: signal recognition particle-docking protein FtsY [Candidatus Cloacimonetes bacterium 4572_65]|nr:MAG: signal recognition particle-docking protein FtsY [Candidatus Cloacimonetes bacterium 4572_65]
MFKFVKKLKDKLATTKNNFIGKIAEAVNIRGKVDEELLEELESILIQGDTGIEMSLDIIEKLRDEIRVNKITDPQEVQRIIQEIMSCELLEGYEEKENVFDLENRAPYIILFIGVNGVGKTTTIGKLAKRFSNEGKSVLLVAGDTFRAAAIEQLDIWAGRADVEIIKQTQGADPSSVVYDGIKSAIARGKDVVMIDTAGRQHNRANLMKELDKIHRTIKKVAPEGPDEVLLVLDATTGQNAVSQAKTFNKMVPLSGLVLTKLDGTAKGGIILNIKRELKVPVKLIGVGEGIEDLQDFDAKDFVEAMFKQEVKETDG